LQQKENEKHNDYIREKSTFKKQINKNYLSIDKSFAIEIDYITHKPQTKRDKTPNDKESNTQ